MNKDLFHQANMMVMAGDYETALRLYQATLSDDESLEPGDKGLLHHRIGNCYTKMKRYDEAIDWYNQASADTDYDACGSLNYNIGMAYAALRDYTNAVKHFEISISDSGYKKVYKAHLALGNVLLKMGKSAEAGVEFREAALDEANPDPTKALLNLGVCFMALDRPADAVASYESALQFDMKQNVRNKLYASLGQAYVACGQMQKAVESFEQSIADRTYFLSSSATVDYQRAVAAVSQGTAETTQAIPSLANDTSGLDVSVSTTDAPGAHQDEQKAADNDNYYYADAYDNAPYGDSEERFFNATDEELERWSRGVVKQDRKRRGVGLKILIAFMVVILLALAGGVVLYLQGYGYPTQQQTVEKLFTNTNGNDTQVFHPRVKEADIKNMKSLITPNANVSIDKVAAGASISKVFVTASEGESGAIRYQITLARDLVGWKITNVELYFASRN